MRKFKIVGTHKVISAYTYSEALSKAIAVAPNADIVEI
jgi:hypothetical protein